MCSGSELLWHVAGCGTGPSCGEQEAPHRPDSTVPAGREESLHLLQRLVSPSYRAMLLLLSLASSGCVPYCGSGQPGAVRGIDQKKVNVEPKMRSMGARTLMEFY
ncbi:hypothetical protein MHYP_G00164910 [Metynnis hypsauchen]